MTRSAKLWRSAVSLVLLAMALSTVGGAGSTVLAASASSGGEALPSQTSGLLPRDGTYLFPIGCYELPKDDAELEAMARSGINLVRCRNGSDLDRAASAGIMGWMPLPMHVGNRDSLREQIASVATHPALAIWEGPDEIVHNFTAWSGLYRKKGVYQSPDEWRRQTPAAVAYSEGQASQIIPNLRDAVELIHTLDRAKRQIWINEAAQSDVKFVRQYMDSIDITGCDIYPVRARAYDLAVVGDATERWKKVGRQQKPVWMVLQAFSWSELGEYYGHKTVAYPSFAESRFMAYDAIVHGARGILYWGSHYLKSSEFRQSLYALTSELAALQPFLVAPAYSKGQVALIELDRDLTQRGVRMSIRQAGDEWLIILVNEDARAYMGVELTGLDELNGRDMELLYGVEEARVSQGELVTRMKPFEVKLFATSRSWETTRRAGRDFEK